MHLATGRRAMFSTRNNEDGSNARGSGSDIAAAEFERWWGKAITASQSIVRE
jgi:hypothetical protein